MPDLAPGSEVKFFFTYWVVSDLPYAPTWYFIDCFAQNLWKRKRACRFVWQVGNQSFNSKAQRGFIPSKSNHKISNVPSELHGWEIWGAQPMNFVFKKMGLPQSLFWLFSSFRTENLSSRQDSNSDCRSRRQECRPLDHHHGLKPIT